MRSRSLLGDGLQAGKTGLGKKKRLMGIRRERPVDEKDVFLFSHPGEIRPHPIEVANCDLKDSASLDHAS
jgi:hypothetical protein